VTEPNFPAGCKSPAADYVPTSRADTRRYANFVIENFDRDDWPPTRRRRKRRRLSLARAMREGRKAGVDVTVDADGTITLRFGETAAASTGNELDEWMAKHHAHQA
jgi:hypothetical protein